MELLIFLVLSAVMKAVMDKLQFHFSTSIFYNLENWNPRNSWRNKWKNGDPNQGERFWGSSRWFVRFTDAWHNFQSFMLTFMFLAIVNYKTFINWYVDFIIIYLIFTTIFELTFRLLTKK
jgi:hypothetical protein